MISISVKEPKKIYNLFFLLGLSFSKKFKELISDIFT